MSLQSQSKASIQTEINGVEVDGHIIVTGMTIGRLKVNERLWGFYLVAEKELIRVGVESMDERVRGMEAIEKWLCTVEERQSRGPCKVCGGLLTECGGTVAYGLTSLDDASSPSELEAFAIGEKCFPIVKATVDVIEYLQEGDCHEACTHTS
jgi:hypothetical protein